MTYMPDYRNLVCAAKNQATERISLYEHIICTELMEEITGKRFYDLCQGDHTDKVEFFRHYCGFFRDMGYDTVSYEYCMTSTLLGGGSLGGHKPGEITCKEDFDRYPWHEIVTRYVREAEPFFLALREALPAGMKAIGGVGNGVFECVQDLVGYMDLCYLSVDDPDTYAALFATMGSMLLAAWQWLLPRFGDVYCVCRFGDDLGYRTSTLLPPADLRTHILPQYRRIVDFIHAHDRPFLLHSCGYIFDVMEDIIGSVGIDAKHSNEDAIAPFPVWVERYGDRIGNFGGIDTDAVCRLSAADMREYIHDVLRACVGRGGLAFGSGNSIPNYVPADGFLNMTHIVREYNARARIR